MAHMLSIVHPLRVVVRTWVVNTPSTHNSQFKLDTRPVRSEHETAVDRWMGRSIRDSTTSTNRRPIDQDSLLQDTLFGFQAAGRHRDHWRRSATLSLKMLEDLTVSYLSALTAGKRSRGGAIGLLFYDYLISLDSEVDLVWTKNKRHPAFFLYICNRWFAFVYYVWDSIPMTPSGVVASNICVIYLMCDAMITLTATILVQVILQLRIYALYQRSRKILILLITLSAMEVSAMVILVGVTMGSLDRLPIISTPTGCAYQGLLKTSALFWLPGLVFEPVLFALVAYRAWGDSGSLPIVKRIARDSLIYFVAIFSQLLINSVIWARYPEYINIVNPWSAALPSLLGSRLFLRMRRMSYTEKSGSYVVETYVLQTPLQVQADDDTLQGSEV